MDYFTEVRKDGNGVRGHKFYLILILYRVGLLMLGAGNCLFSLFIYIEYGYIKY